MKLMVNGSEEDWAEETKLVDVLAALATGVGIEFDGRGVAVAVNDRVVRRQGWEQVVLGEGDAIEVLTAVPGG